MRKVDKGEGVNVINVNDGDLENSKKGKEKKERCKDYSRKDTLLVMFTFINCCVGSGLLAIGKIFSTAGFVMAAIYMVASVAYCFWSFNVLSAAGYHGNFSSMRESGAKLWGRKYGLFVDVFLICATMGFFCSYVSVSSDYIRDGIYRLGHVDVLGTEKWRIWFKPIVAIVIIFPLTLMRTIDIISLVSSFAIIFALVAFIGINIRFFQYLSTGKVNGIEHPRPPIPVLPASNGWPATIAYFTTFFALFTIQPNMIPLQRELKGTATQRRKVINVASRATILICTVIYVITGIEGAIMFNRSCTEEEVSQGCIAINGNILLTFGDDMAMIIIKLLYAIVVLVSFPCMIYPVRASICGWFKIDKFNGKKTHPNMTREERKQLPINIRLGYLWYILIGLIVIIIVTIIAIAIPDIDKVLSIIANIFGLVIYEVHEVWVWFKLPQCKKYSIGKLFDEKLITNSDAKKDKKDKKSKKNKKNKAEQEKEDKKVNDVENLSKEQKEKNEEGEGKRASRPKINDSDCSNGSMMNSKGFSKIGEAYRTSIGSITDARKYSLVLENKFATKKELAKAFGRKSGERTWDDEDTVSCSSEDFPNLGHGDKTSDSNTSSSSSSSSSTSTKKGKEGAANKKRDELDNGIGEDSDSASVSGPKESARASLRKYSSLQSRATSVIEGCPEGAVEVVFPDVSSEPYKKKSCRFAVFIIFNVFFIGFSVCATACDIAGWIVR